MAALLDPRDYTGDVSLKALIDSASSSADAACENARALEPESSWVYSVSSSLEASRGAFDVAVKWSDAALERGGDSAALHGQRAGWLVEIGMLSEAGRAYQRALTENAEATRRDVTMTFVGAMAAVDAGGAAALNSFVRENGLADSSDPLLLFELANAELLVGDNSWRARLRR
jgi:predicted Zn-dependent protease